MGNVKTKKISSLDRAKRNAAKTAIKAAKLAAREAALPPGTTPKLRHGDLKKLGKGKGKGAPAAIPQIDFDNLVITTAPERAKEALSHVKWTALFKKHLGVLESHVKALDRVAQHLRSYMSGLPVEERIKWEKGEEGNWGKICGLLDRARDTLCNAREASHGLVPEHHLRDKKGLGVTGINYVPLYPQVEALRAGLTTDAAGNGANAIGATTNEAFDSDGDSEMEDAPGLESLDSDSSSSSSGESDDEDSPAPEKKVKEKSNPAPEVEPNPYFVVDTEPTPVNLPKTEAPSVKKGKKRTSDEDIPEKAKKIKKSKSTESLSKETKHKDKSDEDIEEPQPKKSKKAKISKSETVVAVKEPEVDFHALQVQLQAEVDVGEATRDVEALGEGEKESRKEKKRRRSSDGTSEKEGKKHKKDKSEGKKRKA
ncbi:hypothetical protein HYALB_00013249 [Hymenoscyphus albidus]|uniref:Uncharacterized protein n=1 Tax=Hymenoscyphus albidus TaxID=595503 RepID=A0A9N9LTP5_9HELO|nr:hypothetical protein HYALB_00013249 [Hymenoscyphus albidus]